MRAPLETVPDPDGLYRGEHTEPYRGSNVWRAHREEMIAEIPHLREKARKFGLTFDTPAPPPPATDPQGWVPLVRGTEIAKCPTYCDGCHCTAATVQHNIERADRAEAERDAARAELAEIFGQLGFLDGTDGHAPRRIPTDVFIAAMKESLARQDRGFEAAAALEALGEK